MTRITKATIWMLAILFAGMTVAAMAGEKQEKVAVKDLPKAVATAIQKAFPGGVIRKTEKEVEEGALVYEVKVNLGGKMIEVGISPAGKILDIEQDNKDEEGDEKDDDEEKVSIKDLPKAVTDAVQKALPGGVMEEAEKETGEGQVVYEVEVEIGEKEFEVEISADGRILEVEENDDEKEDRADD